MFSCSVQLSMKFEKLIGIKNNEKFSFFSVSDKPIPLFSLFINVKMPTIVGIFTFMGRKNFMFS